MSDHEPNWTLPTEYERDHKIMVDYLLLQVRDGDWHGVRDAATDIEVMEAKQRV